MTDFLARLGIEITSTGTAAAARELDQVTKAADGAARAADRAKASLSAVGRASGTMGSGGANLNAGWASSLTRDIKAAEGALTSFQSSTTTTTAALGSSLRAGIAGLTGDVTKSWGDVQKSYEFGARRLTRSMEEETKHRSDIIARAMGSDAAAFVKNVEQAERNLRAAQAKAARQLFDDQLELQGVRQHGFKASSASASGAVFQEQFRAEEAAAKRAADAAKAAAAAQAAASAQSAAAARDNARAQEQLAQRARAFRAEIDPTAAAQARLTDRLREAAELHRAGAITQREYSASTRLIRAELDALQSVGAAGFASAIAGAKGLDDQLRAANGSLALFRGGIVALAGGGAFAAVIAQLRQMAQEADAMAGAAMRIAQRSGNPAGASNLVRGAEADADKRGVPTQSYLEAAEGLSRFTHELGLTGSNAQETNINLRKFNDALITAGMNSGLTSQQASKAAVEFGSALAKAGQLTKDIFDKAPEGVQQAIAKAYGRTAEQFSRDLANQSFEVPARAVTAGLERVGYQFIDDVSKRLKDNTAQAEEKLGKAWQDLSEAISWSFGGSGDTYRDALQGLTGELKQAANDVREAGVGAAFARFDSRLTAALDQLIKPLEEAALRLARQVLEPLDKKLGTEAPQHKLEPLDENSQRFGQGGEVLPGPNLDTFSQAIDAARDTVVQTLEGAGTVIQRDLEGAGSVLQGAGEVLKRDLESVGGVIRDAIMPGARAGELLNSAGDKLGTTAAQVEGAGTRLETAGASAASRIEVAGDTLAPKIEGAAIGLEQKLVVGGDTLVAKAGEAGIAFGEPARQGGIEAGAAMHQGGAEAGAAVRVGGEAGGRALQEGAAALAVAAQAAAQAAATATSAAASAEAAAAFALASGRQSNGSGQGDTGYAEGGLITGPGTGTTDSIPALVDGKRPIRVANGEFIVNAVSTRKHRDLLEALNRGGDAEELPGYAGMTPGFAEGGLIDFDSSYYSPTSGSSTKAATAAAKADKAILAAEKQAREIGESVARAVLSAIQSSISTLESERDRLVADQQRKVSDYLAAGPSPYERNPDLYYDPSARRSYADNMFADDTAEIAALGEQIEALEDIKSAQEALLAPTEEELAEIKRLLPGIDGIMGRLGADQRKALMDAMQNIAQTSLQAQATLAQQLAQGFNALGSSINGLATSGTSTAPSTGGHPDFKVEWPAAGGSGASSGASSGGSGGGSGEWRVRTNYVGGGGTSERHPRTPGPGTDTEKWWSNGNADNYTRWTSNYGGGGGSTTTYSDPWNLNGGNTINDFWGLDTRTTTNTGTSDTGDTWTDNGDLWNEYADGGLVRGPGTGTSDSIPARLSNGEFVVRAGAAREHRDVLEHINAGRGIGPVVRDMARATAHRGIGQDVRALVANDDNRPVRKMRGIGESVRGLARTDGHRGIGEDVRALAEGLPRFAKGGVADAKRHNADRRIGSIVRDMAQADGHKGIGEDVRKLVSTHDERAERARAMAEAPMRGIGRTVRDMARASGHKGLGNDVRALVAANDDHAPRGLGRSARDLARVDDHRALGENVRALAEAMPRRFAEGGWVEALEQRTREVAAAPRGGGVTADMIRALFARNPGDADLLALPKLDADGRVIGLNAQPEWQSAAAPVDFGSMLNFGSPGSTGTAATSREDWLRETWEAFKQSLTSGPMGHLYENMVMPADWSGAPKRPSSGEQPKWENKIDPFTGRISSGYGTFSGTPLMSYGGGLQDGKGGDFEVKPGTFSVEPGTFSVKPGTFKASGGAVYGPGTGTSDSIPAMLSNGEFVIRASEAAKHRDLLEMINAGQLPAFAEGGAVELGPRSERVNLLPPQAAMPAKVVHQVRGGGATNIGNMIVQIQGASGSPGDAMKKSYGDVSREMRRLARHSTGR